jgi:hypothetical protein
MTCLVRDEQVISAPGVWPSPVAAPLRTIEKAWIHTCEVHESLRRLGDAAFIDTGFSPGSAPERVASALERCGAAGVITTAHLAVLALAGQRGRAPDMACAIAYRLWTEAMAALAAELPHTVADEFAGLLPPMEF